MIPANFVKRIFPYIIALIVFGFLGGCSGNDDDDDSMPPQPPLKPPLALDQPVITTLNYFGPYWGSFEKGRMEAQDGDVIDNAEVWAGCEYVSGLQCRDSLISSPNTDLYFKYQDIFSDTQVTRFPDSPNGGETREYWVQVTLDQVPAAQTVSQISKRFSGSSRSMLRPHVRLANKMLADPTDYPDNYDIRVETFFKARVIYRGGEDENGFPVYITQTLVEKRFLGDFSYSMADELPDDSIYWQLPGSPEIYYDIEQRITLTYTH